MGRGQDRGDLRLTPPAETRSAAGCHQHLVDPGAIHVHDLEPHALQLGPLARADPLGPAIAQEPVRHQPEPPRTQEAAAPASVPAELSAHVLRRLAALDLAGHTDDEQTLTRALIAGLQARAAALAESGAVGHAGGRAALAAFAAAALARLAQEAPLAQELMEIELALTLSETALRLGAVDRMLDEAR